MSGILIGKKVSTLPDVVIAVRVERAEFVAVGATFDHECSRCRHKVVLCGTGLAFVRQGSKPVCMQCLNDSEIDEALECLRAYGAKLGEQLRADFGAGIRVNTLSSFHHLRRN